MAQTYQSIELLVIDDGSTDGTFAKLRKLKPECEKRFVRVVFETHENQGICKTLNTLLDKAEGKYVYLIASDDVAKPQAIETLHAFLSENPDYVLAVGDNELIDGDSKRIGWNNVRQSRPFEKSVCRTFGQALRCNRQEFGIYTELLKGNHIPNGYLMRADAVRKTCGYTFNPEDWNMMLQLAKVGKFKFISDVLFSYRWHDNNTVNSAKYKSKIRENRKKQLLAEREYCFENGFERLWKNLWFEEVGFLRFLFKIKNCRRKMFRVRLSKNKKIIRLFGITFYQKENDDG